MTTAIAYNRFGLGRRADAPVLSDPKGWLRDQIPAAGSRAFSAGPSTEEMLDATRAFREDRKGRRQAMADGKPPRDQPTSRDPMDAAQKLGAHYMAQMGTRLQAAVTTQTPFAERLVHFWSNHFAISADKIKVRALAGPFENEAIRPHIAGYFTDMLLTVAQHPAMILYLDNEQSIGAGSAAAQRRVARTTREFGLNENLAREIMELHSLGVRSVYSQADVTELARAITGWSVQTDGRATQLRGEAGAHGFMFYPPLHEPGGRTVLARNYPAGNLSQGIAILKDLSLHPATARFIATKLARHFIADDPPPSAIARLEKAFTDSRGHLPTVYRALIDLPESWEPGLRKFKTPWEYVISALRLVNVTSVDVRPTFQALRLMGQPPMAPGSPAGWPDVASRWLNSDAIAKRLSFIAILAARAPATIDARALASDLFGEMLTQTTSAELARAESGTQALTLLLASPEFMRR
jgi:uncharacterized protein (DUF1800 family)